MVLSPGRLFGIAKLTEVLDMATGGDSTDSREGITMIETASFTSFVVIPRTGEHGGYENECFTHYVQGNGGRCCLRGPMVQSNAEWLANKMIHSGLAN